MLYLLPCVIFIIIIKNIFTQNTLSMKQMILFSNFENFIQSIKII